MRALRWSALTLVLFGCPDTSSRIDGGEEAPIQYEGETEGGAIPVVEVPNEFPEEDAGEFEVDRRCCNIVFSVPDIEDAMTSGRVVGTFGPVSGVGVPLIRGNGHWSAIACMPVTSHIEYWFEFSTPDGSDAGTEDAGAQVNIVRRHDENASTTTGLDGTKVNVFPSVNDCASVDASTGMAP